MHEFVQRWGQAGPPQWGPIGLAGGGKGPREVGWQTPPLMGGDADQGWSQSGGGASGNCWWPIGALIRLVGLPSIRHSNQSFQCSGFLAFIYIDGC